MSSAPHNKTSITIPAPAAESSAPASSTPVQQKAELTMVPGGADSSAATHAPQKIDMAYLIKALVKYGASDLHLRAGRPPMYRVHGRLVPAKMDSLDREQVQGLVYSVLNDRQIRQLEEKRNIDLSFRVGDFGRFRCNGYYQRGQLAAVIRMIPIAIPKMEDLGVPAVLKELAGRPRGLLLICGATGSGKSSTLASVIQYLNETSNLHILTIEDPIEFVYRDDRSSVSQREVGSDTHSLQDALIAGLRQDPDVILIGEMRDKETIACALTAAETGHLVVSTLHTKDAKGTIERIVDVFPAEAKNQVRMQLASSLVGVIVQQLVPKADGSGRVLAAEIMVKSPTIEEHILRGEIEKIPEAITASTVYYKMQSMNQALEKLVKAGSISPEEAMRSSSNPDELKLKLSGFTRDEGYEVAGFKPEE